MGIALLLTFPNACPWDEPGNGNGNGASSGNGNGNDDNDEPCGNGEIDEGEECDDSGVISGDGCSDVCTHEPCTWTLDRSAFPINVWMGQAVYGEIAFDGNCNLIVGGGEEAPNVEALYRVNKDDGSVSVAVADLPTGVVAGITYRESDNRIYFSNDIQDGSNHLYALDDQDQLELLLILDRPTISLTFAPESFGDFGNHLIAVTYGPPQLLAIDLDTQVITPFAQSNMMLSVAKFGNDGTLYVAELGADRISTVTPDGVFTPFITGLDAPDGLAISPDGTRMFVGHQVEEGRRIDQISIPDATLTAGILSEFSVGFPTGIVVDGTDRVFYEMPLANYAAIGVFDAP